MDVEKVGPSGPSSSDRRVRKSTPDSEEFKEMMKTGKVGEAEFEKPKKRKSEAQEEEPPPMPEAPQREKITEPTPFSQPQINVPKDKGTIERPQVTQKPTSTEDTQDDDERVKESDEESQIKEKKKAKTDEVVVFKKAGIVLEPKGKKLEKEKTEIVLPESTEKIFIKEKSLPTKEEDKKVLQKKPSFKKEEGVMPSFKEKKSFDETKGKKEEKIDYKHEISTVLQEMPTNISAQTQSLTAPLTPYLHPDIIPLFEKMVGTIIQIQAQGITTTQVMLNSPAFTSSIFFGSSIVLEKYSTAPDSFNIFLKGPQQAVTMFNNNLDGLLEAFNKGNFNFKIGRLEAEHERPLFKRKEKTSDKDQDTGANK